MFFFWNKKVDYQKIKDFKDAINAVKVFIWTQEWEKAKSALKEIRAKEKTSFEESLKLLTNDSEKEKLTKEFNTNNRTIDVLEQKIKVKEELYKEKQAQEIFELKFKKIREEIHNLSKS
jgi:CTP-dependent riboflavin kinase